jgi:hypothetical protein
MSVHAAAKASRFHAIGLRHGICVERLRIVSFQSAGALRKVSSESLISIGSCTVRMVRGGPHKQDAARLEVCLRRSDND